MADIFDEINEELKQDRMAALWQRYGKYLIAVVVAIVAGVSLSQGYSYYTNQRDARSTDAFFQAILADDVTSSPEAAAPDLNKAMVCWLNSGLLRLWPRTARRARLNNAIWRWRRADADQIYRTLLCCYLSCMPAVSGCCRSASTA